LGLLAGLLTLLFTLIFPLIISASFGFFVLIFLTGLHHLDGLLDFGDAIFTRGSMKRRKEVMHDSNTGVGGFTAGLFTTITGVLVSYEFLSAGGSPIHLFLAAETLAKLSLIIAAGLGKIAFEGMGSVFIKTLGKSRWQMPLSIILTALILWPFTGPATLLLISIPLLSAPILVWTSNKMVGGVSGDGFGFLNEVTRLIVMMVMMWML
jgi:adenosylcobinamide-GDP ribazoletransferase